MKFTHLHVHTEYSLLDGSNKIKEYVARVKELGMDSAAITDHGVMYGVIDFYRAAKAAGINPVLGCEVYVAPNSRFDREIGKDEDRYYHLVLLAENNTGYSNLMKIVSKGFVEGFYYKPRVDMEVLNRYHEGIIALSACLAGEVQRYLARGMYEEACRGGKEIRDHLWKRKLFPGASGSWHSGAENGESAASAHESRSSASISWPPTTSITPTPRMRRPTIFCSASRLEKNCQDEDRMRYEGGQYYVKSPEEMEALFPYAKEALENTWKIAQRCHVEIEFGVTKLPKFDVPKEYTSWEYLNKLCHEGLVKHYGDPSPELHRAPGI